MTGSCLSDIFVTSLICLQYYLTGRRLPPGGTLGWEKYDRASNNGFPPGTCGGCGAPDHFRNDCPDNPHKGKFPPRKGKGKGKGKGKWGKGKGVGGVDDEEWTEETEAEWNAQNADEGGSVWDADEEESAWAVDDSDDEDDYACVATDARHFSPSSFGGDGDEEPGSESEKSYADISHEGSREGKFRHLYHLINSQGLQTVSSDMLASFLRSINCSISEVHCDRLSELISGRDKKEFTENDFARFMLENSSS